MVVPRDSRVVPMEVAQELAADGAALPWKAGQNRKRQQRQGGLVL